jgi:uncharacterized protein YecT (DUF1311 family)
MKGIWLIICIALTTNMYAAVDCSELTSTHEILNCLNEQYEQADSELNYYYQQLKQQLDQESYQVLRSAQLAWIKQRDAQCEYEALEMQGGTFESVLRTDCFRRMTEQRVDFLKRELGLQPVADMQCNEALQVGGFSMQQCILDKRMITVSNLGEYLFVYSLVNDTVESDWEQGSSLTLSVVEPFSEPLKFSFKNYDQVIAQKILEQQGVSSNLVIKSKVFVATCGDVPCFEINFTAEQPRGEEFHRGQAKFKVSFDLNSKVFTADLFQIIKFN